MRRPPVEVIKSWPKPNYVNPETRGNALVAVHIAFLIVCFVVVAARLWARMRIVRSAGLDDLLIAIAMIPTVGVTVSVIVAVSQYGWDRHVWDVPVSQLVPSRYTAWWAQICFVIAAGFTKVSILLFYRRMTAATMHKTFLYVIFGAIGFMVIYTVTFALILLLGCRPLSAYWNSVLPTYKEPYVCYDESTALLTACIMSVLTDVIVIALPYSVVWSLQMPFRQKLTLSVIFGIGLIVVAAGIVRTVFVWETISLTYDVTWVGYDTWLWTAVEADLAIICACTPALKPFFGRYFGSSLGSTKESKGTALYANSRGRLGSLAPPDSLSRSRTGDIVLGRSTSDYVSITEVSRGDTRVPNTGIKGGKVNVVVITELSVVEKRNAGEENDYGGYSSSATSTKDFSRPY